MTPERDEMSSEDEREKARRELESERARRELALEASGLGDWELDLRTQSAPRRSLRHDEIFGYPEGTEEWSFETFLTHVHPLDREAVEAAFQQALENGTPWDFECRIIRADGEQRWIWARGSRQSDPDGTPIRMLGVVSDITRRKEVHEELRRAAEMDAFRVALNDALRPLGDPAEIQATAARILGVHLGAARVHYAEIDERGEVALVRADYSDGVPSVVGRHVLDEYGAPVMDEARAGRRIVVHDVSRDRRLSASDQRATEGLGIGAYVVEPLVKEARLVGFLVVHHTGPHDWTDHELALIAETAARTWEAAERGRAEQALREATARAEHANRAKSEFLAVMSHELRTPLNALIGYADLLSMGIPEAIPEGALSQVERIEISARHLLQLIEEVLTFSRLEAGREQLDYQPVDLAELVEEVAVIIGPLAEEKGLAFEVVAPHEPPQLDTDPRKLRQILINLLGNAVKFTAAGAVGVEIGIGAEEVRFVVRDTGIGIPAHRIEEVFEPFIQLEGGPARSAGGTGLGLTVSRRLATLMGGSLTVQSTTGRGSAFTLTLPRDPSPEG